VDVRAYIPQSLHAGIAARTDTTDLAVYIQEALNSVSASTSSNGYLLFPDGLYNFASQLFLNGKRNVVLRGLRFNSGAAPIGAQLNYTGTGDATPWNVGNSYGIRFHKLSLTYSNAGFSGHLLYPAGTAVTNTQHFMLDQCTLYGSGVRGAASLVYMDYVINSTIQENYFANATIGIKGADGFSSVILVKKNLFINLTTSAIKDSGQSWLIQNNTFQSLYNGGEVGEPGAYTHTLSGVMAQGLTFDTNWFGDVAAEITGAWLTVAATGFRFVGNVVGLNSGGTGILFNENGATGVEISGNSVSTTTYTSKPAFVKWTTVGHGGFRIGPNMIWGDNVITEISGTMPAGSIYQTLDYDNSGGNKPKVLIGSTDIATGISKLLVNSSTWDIPLIADNVAVNTTITIAGASRGDVAHATHIAASTAGDIFIATVIDTDNVAVTYLNKTGFLRTIIGTLRVEVWKH
jgi:hypothetical protein